MTIHYLSDEEVLVLHALLVQRTGGSDGVRDLGLLSSAVARPKMTFDGEELYPDLWSKAAALMESLVLNHPFVDGNKRAAITATGIFLELNGYTLRASNAEVLAFTMRAAVGEFSLDQIRNWFVTHSQPLDDL